MHPGFRRMEDAPRGSRPAGRRARLRTCEPAANYRCGPFGRSTSSVTLQAEEQRPPTTGNTDTPVTPQTGVAKFNRQLAAHSALIRPITPYSPAALLRPIAAVLKTMISRYMKTIPQHTTTMTTHKMMHTHRSSLSPKE